MELQTFTAKCKQPFSPEPRGQFQPNFALFPRRDNNKNAKIL